MNELIPAIQEFANLLDSEKSRIDDSRKLPLDTLAEAIVHKRSKKERCDIITICTHNSRRSFIAQILLRLASLTYNLQEICVFSGGTEATAFNPRVIKAFEQMGFEINKLDRRSNPKYHIPLLKDDPSREVYFSKSYENPYNPQKNFIAILVCNHADQSCPLVLGAASRHRITYRDPKEFDNTAREEQAYANKILEIGREMFYVMDQVKMSLMNEL